MSQKLAELLLLISSALFTGVVIFVADVLQQVMNDLDEATFGRFVTILYKPRGKGYILRNVRHADICWHDPVFLLLGLCQFLVRRRPGCLYAILYYLKGPQSSRLQKSYRSRRP
jgi:hypothetical protein